MNQNRHWILRPVAWVCTILMFLALQFAAELICKLGAYLVYLADGLPTLLIIVLAVLFGGTFCALFFYSALMLSPILVMLSDKIYPSANAFRYYFLGIYEIGSCLILLLAAALGAVKGGSMFWFCARYIWLIITSIVVMVTGHQEAKSRK